MSRVFGKSKGSSSLDDRRDCFDSSSDFSGSPNVGRCTASRNISKATANEAAQPIPPGTKISMQNWQQYRQFMPDGMAALFEGKYAWKMPPDVSLEVGPTVIHPLPHNYM